MSFYDPEGYIDSTDYPPLPLHSFLECTYNVTVYTGYGVELQVRNASGGLGVSRARPPLHRGSQGSAGCGQDQAQPPGLPCLLKVPVLEKK